MNQPIFSSPNKGAKKRLALPLQSKYQTQQPAQQPLYPKESTNSKLYSFTSLSCFPSCSSLLAPTQPPQPEPGAVTAS